MAVSHSKQSRRQSTGIESLPLNSDALLEALPHPLLVLGAGGDVVRANFAAEVFFGISKAVLKRRRIEKLIAFASPLLSLIEQVRHSGATVNEYAVDLGLPESSSQRTVDVYAAPLTDHPGHILLMLQERGMAQMIERQLTHRDAARSVSGMAAVLAHEVKNPLSGIRGAAQLLESNANAEDQPLAQLICRETDRICDLVDRMEVFSDERPLKLEPVNIHTVLDHVQQIAENGFARSVAFTQEYDPSLPPLPGNQDQLIQAFLNLVKNAAEAVSPGSDGHILLSTAFRPGLRLSLPNSGARVSLPLEITITDNGPGIPEELKAHLFEPFVTTKACGTGLGLALVAKIIGDHGGTIECETRPRHTSFRVRMPMYRGDQSKQKMPGRGSGKAAGGKSEHQQE